MKSFKYLLRQPLKTAMGILLTAFAVATLCIGVGQAVSAKATAQMLEESFTTVAVHSPMAQTVEYTFTSHTSIHNSDVLNEWVQQLAQEHPEIVKQIANHGLASAHIPELNPVGYYGQEYLIQFGTMASYQPEPHGAPWSCAMLEITLDSIGEPVIQHISFSQDVPRNVWEFNSYEEYNEYWLTAEKTYVTTGYTIELVGTITQVISLQEQFGDPTGMWARLSYTVPTLEAAEKFLDSLTLGERYLVYGMDYYDTDLEVRISKRRSLTIDKFDMNFMRDLTAQEIDIYAKSGGITPTKIYKGLPIYEYELEKINTVTLTLPSAYDRVEYIDIRDEAGKLLEIQEITQRTITDEIGEEHTVSAAEYGAYYQIPNIVQLEGTAEEFLNLETGKDWVEILNQAKINNQAFPVVGVDDLSYIARFADQSARILEGREFSQEELETGANVCVISQELAAANGLSVGDVIHTNFYNADENLPYQGPLSADNGIINPTAAFYGSTTPLLGEESYTIVGIYRCDNPWAEIYQFSNLTLPGADHGHYTFTPNVIFAPKASIPSLMQYHNKCFFETVILHNGMMEDFKTLARKTGLAGQFSCYDQGYTQIVGNFHDYEVVSRQAMYVSASVYVVILLLFLLLFPGSQRKHIRLMETLGAGAGKRRRYIVLSSLCMLLPAALLGAGLGIALWNQIVGALIVYSQVSVTMEMDIVTITSVAGGSLLLALMLTALVSVWVARPKKLSARR